MSTPVIICQGQSHSAWLHNVVLQEDFLTEWGAADKAADLAFEFGYCQVVCGSTPNFGVRCPRSRSGPRFDDHVKIFLFHEDVTGQVSMPRDVFEGKWDKPWKMHQSPRSDFLFNDNLADCCDSPHVYDLWCVDRNMMPLDQLPSMTGMHGEHGAQENDSPPPPDDPLSQVCQAVETSIKQQRPNQELQQDFDDIIPYTFRGIPGLVVPPPNWQENPIFRIAASSGIATRDGSGRLTMMVRAWLVKHGEDRIRAYRDFAIRPQLLVHLPETVRRVWLDQIGATAHLIVHAVRPTPLAEPDGTRFLHVIGEVSRPRVCGYQPVLIASRQITANGVEDPEWYPCLMPIRFGVADVFGVAQPRCELFQVLVPMQGRVRRWLTPYIQREATPSMFLPTWWDRRLQPLPAPPYDQASDDTSLMQKTVQRVVPVQSRLPEDPPSAQEHGSCQSDQDLLQQLEQLAPRHPHTIPDDVARATFSHHLDMLVTNGINARSPQVIETYGLYVQPIGKRTFRVEDLATQTLLAEIRRVWHDIPHPFTAILVRPSEEEPTKIILIVEFLDFHRLPLQGTTPTLRTILDADLPGPIVQAAYHVGEVQPYMLVGQVPLRHKCQPWNDRRCEVRLNGHLLLPLSRSRLEEGDRIEFHVHQQEETDEGDEGLALMQRSVSRSPRRGLPASTSTASSGPDLMSVHTFHMSADHKLVQLDKSMQVSYAAQLQQIWRFPQHTSILRLHEVRYPPLDLESTSQATLLIEGTVDLNRQAIADDQLILVDLVLSGAAGLADAIRIRRVVWIRRFITRPAVLHLLSVQEFCNSPEVACRLLLNHEVWDYQDTALREMRNGDFLCLRVSGPVSMTSNEVRLVLTDQEHADSTRFLYCSSPQKSPRSATPEEEGGESEHEVYQDPLVDTLQSFADNAGPVLEDWTNKDLELRFSPSDHAGAGFGKLQQGKRGKRLMSHGCLNQTVDPHVSDLWCVKQSGADSLCIPSSTVAVAAISSTPDDPERESSQQRQVLYLQDHLPQQPREFTEGCVASSIPGLQELVDYLLQPRLNLEVDVPLLEIMEEELKHLVQTALSVPHQRNDCPVLLQVYTDGSKLWNVERAEEVSAWAVVIVATWPDGQEGIIGCQSAAVQTAPDQLGWLGSTWPDSYQAEMEAIIRALIWLCQEPMIQGGLDCVLVADATSALFATDGTFGIQHPALRKFVRPLHKFLSNITGVQLRWQKSHVGNVYNELADHLAKYRARQSTPHYECSPFSNEDLEKLPWIWMVHSQSSGRHPVYQEGSLWLPVPAPLTGIDVSNLTSSNAGTESQCREFALTLASHNVNSFKDAKEGRNLTWTGRAEMIRQQVVEQGFKVVGWQETRRSFSGQWTSSNFIGFEGNAKHGKGGVAIWFRKDLPYAWKTSPDEKPQPLYFQVQGFTVHCAHSECMVVEYQDEGWRGVFISAHAPTDVDSFDVKQAFWDMLAQKLAPHSSKDVFLMIDANARVGSQADHSIGLFAADDANENGDLLHRLLLQHDLWLPATFETCVADWTLPQGTWLSKGGWKRIDYVATNVPSERASVCTWTHILEKDTMQEDHKAVCTSIRFRRHLSAQRLIRCHTTLKVDQNAMSAPAGKEVCKQILIDLTATCPGWTASADAHALHINLGAQAALEKSFPFQSARPKPSWISDETWTTLLDSRRIRRHLQQLRMNWRVGVMRLIFESWRDQSFEDHYYRHWMKQHDFATADALHQLHLTKVSRIAMLRRDEAQHLTQLAEEARDELQEAKGTSLWKSLKRSLPKFRKRRRKPLPMASAQDTMAQHFAETEDAVKVSGSSLVSTSLQRSGHALTSAIAQSLPVQELPTIFELEEAIRTLHGQKAFIGCVPAELLKASPSHAAELLYPSLVMFFRFFQQPLSWKGGQYYPLYKGKGPSDDPKSFRAILIGNVVPKVFHKIVRARLMASAQPYLLPFQIGGVPRMSVHFAAHFLQSLRHQANVRKRSSAVIFFDLRSAFYRAQRSTVVRDRLGYGDEIEDEDVAISTLTDPVALESVQVPDSLQMVVQELFSQTWCTVPTNGAQQPAILRSVRGTRPGDPVADLTFTCVMKQILERFMRVALPMLPVLNTASGDISVPAITWVDDVAIYLESADARDLLPTAKAVVQTMHQQCRMVGLDLNYAHGKTEVLFRLHGRHSDTIRRELRQAGTVALGPGDWDQVRLPVTTRYTHLGIKHSANLSFDVELGYRLARAREALTDSRKCILQNEAIPPDTRWTLARSLVLSRLFFGCEIWPVLTVAQHQKCQQFLFKIARVILKQENFAETDHTTDDSIGAVLPVPSITTILRVARLRYAARLYRHAPDILLALLHQMEALENESWIQRIQQDMEWLQQRTPGLGRLLPPHLDFSAWIAQLKHARDWAAMVQRAFQADTLRRFTLARYQMWRLQFREGLVQAGGHFPIPVPSTEPDVGSEWRCAECGQGFHSQKALSVHKYKKHSQHALARSYMDSSVCGHCLKDYHTIQRLRQHLQYPQGRCLGALQQVWWPVDALNLQSFRPAIDSKAAHRIPAIQCYGPQLPTRQQWLVAKPDKLLPDPPADEEVQTDLQETEREDQAGDHGQVPEVVCIDLLTCMEEYAAQCNSQEEEIDPPDLPEFLQPASFATIATFSRRLQEELVHHMDFAAYLQVYGWVERLLGQHFVQQRRPPPQHDSDARPNITVAPPQVTPQPTWTSDHDLMPSFSPVIERQPRRVGSTRYILYLYSGHRREGDMIEWAHTLGDQRDMAVEVISLDIVYDAKLCDMRDPHSRAVWMGYVRSGFFLGVVGAPPCETYSAARMRAITEQDGGPPPLRSVTEPWGLSTLTLRQQRQVLVSNDLMQGWLMFFITAYSTGTAVLMEHPAESSRHPEAASIWRTAELRMIDQMQNAKRHLVIQGLYGAVSAKPTTFAACHIPRFAQILRAWVAPDAAIRARSWIRLEGKNEDGTWKTAQGKAYPSRLNAALVDCMLQGSLCAEEIEMTADFRKHTQVVIKAQQTSGSVMGPDYAANSVPI